MSALSIPPAATTTGDVGSGLVMVDGGSQTLRCYICLEVAHDAPKLCLCNNMRVHRECLASFLASRPRKGAPRCTVCRAKLRLASGHASDQGHAAAMAVRCATRCAAASAHAIGLFGLFILVTYFVFVTVSVLVVSRRISGGPAESVLGILAAEHLVVFVPLALFLALACFGVAFQLQQNALETALV
jgi:hypothetical protein